MARENRKVTPREIRQHAKEVYSQSWKIHYDGAQCGFETSSQEDAVLYDLEVPEQVQNQGIGTAMVKAAEKIVKEETEAEVLYAQIGASNDSTRHVLKHKCGFQITGEYYKEELGKIIDAMKKLD